MKRGTTPPGQILVPKVATLLLAEGLVSLENTSLLLVVISILLVLVSMMLKCFPLARYKQKAAR